MISQRNVVLADRNDDRELQNMTTVVHQILTVAL